MRILKRGLWAILLIASARMAGWAEEGVISVPRLSQPPVIDGDLSEWKALAFTDGEWTLDRLRQTPWYDPERNRLTIHENESPLDEDLRATYYVAWDQEYLYLGAEAHDNVRRMRTSAGTTRTVSAGSSRLRETKNPNPLARETMPSALSSTRRVPPTRPGGATALRVAATWRNRCRRRRWTISSA